MHGSAFAHIVFMNEGSTVIEMFPYQYTNEHNRILCEVVGPSSQPNPSLGKVPLLALCFALGPSRFCSVGLLAFFSQLSSE
jgi:hypothetical protein